MKQYRITAENLNQDSADDAYLAPNDPIHEIKALAGLGGLGGAARLHEYRAGQLSYGETFGQAGQEKTNIMRKNDIRPGDAEWFSLWFSLPYFKKNDDIPTVSSLRKTAKQGGRKGQLAHWMANMKAGKAKKK